jgi:protein-S-isoprenylcysteine O-methyltransferase Ste14
MADGYFAELGKAGPRTVLWLACMAALLFIPAGTLRWPGAWVFLIEIAVGGLATELWLAQHDPALLAERRSGMFQRAQSGSDKALLAAIPLLLFACLPLMALDAVRFETSRMPAWVQAIGALAIALSFVIVYLAYRENSFAAPVAKIQQERGQKVATSGVYGFVRHPIYAGGLLYYLGIPLLLGSWYGLVFVPIMFAIIALRSVMEERVLTAELDGYSDYAGRVRYRLVPMIW